MRRGRYVVIFPYSLLLVSKILIVNCSHSSPKQRKRNLNTKLLVGYTKKARSASSRRLTLTSTPIVTFRRAVPRRRS